MENYFIPTYVINLKQRTDRRRHILQQFKGKSEFDVKIIEAIEHKFGRVGLWASIVNIIKIAKENKDEVILICEDDHQFTENYSKELLIKNIIEAHTQGADILLGGIGWYNVAVPISDNRIWIDSLWCTQFTIIFAKFFDSILNEDFLETDTADGKFSVMTRNKMVLYPFVSTQKDFGYSDVTILIDKDATITGLFEETSERLSAIHKIFRFYTNSNL